MENEHLLNTIKLQCSKISSLVSALNSKIQISPTQSALYGLDTTTISNEAQRRLRPTVEAIYPYVCEAMLRGMTEVTLILQTALGRTSAEAQFDIRFLTQSSTTKRILPKLRASAFNDNDDVPYIEDCSY